MVFQISLESTFSVIIERLSNQSIEELQETDWLRKRFILALFFLSRQNLDEDSIMKIIQTPAFSDLKMFALQSPLENERAEIFTVNN
jgi:hypothetical protein